MTVGAEWVVTEQAPPLRTRAQMRAAGFAQQDRDAAGAQLHDVLLNPQLSAYVPASESDGASVGALTRAHPSNDEPAASFDMNAFAQALSNFSSQHVPAVNTTGGKAAAEDCEV